MIIMKIKKLFLFLLLLLLPSVVAAEDNIHVVKIGGQEYTVNPTAYDNGYSYTVKTDGTTYIYECHGAGEITTCSGRFVGNDDYTSTEMRRMEEAIQHYETTYGTPRLEKNESRSGNVMMGLFVIGVGAFLTFAPKAAWYLEIGWKLKDAEPSSIAITMNIFLGIIIGIVGVVMLFT